MGVIVWGSPFRTEERNGRSTNDRTKDSLQFNASAMSANGNLD
jgi:hypothetical protein